MNDVYCHRSEWLRGAKRNQEPGSASSRRAHRSFIIVIIVLSLASVLSFTLCLSVL